MLDAISTKMKPLEEDELLPWFRGRVRSSNTARTFADLIDYLAEQLAKVAVIEAHDKGMHRERVRNFLGRLSLRVGLSFGDQEQRCREFLEGWGVAPELVGGAIDQVVGSLLRRGRPGDQAVTFGELALELRLAQRDLSNWSFLVELSRDRLFADVARPRPGYQEDQDVRRFDPLTPELLRLVSGLEVDQPDASFGLGTPSRNFQPVVVWGKSGIGKTWLLARAAWQLAQARFSSSSSVPALLWISSEQDPRSDLEAAARKFCHHIWGREQPLPMELLADRVSQVAGPMSTPWLVVFVDGIQSQGYLDRLSELLHSELGVLLVLAVTIQRSDNSPEKPGLRFLNCPGFNQDEVLSFLDRHLPLSKGLPPPDVRKLLETPVFCAMYAALKQDGAVWQLWDEYALVQRFWLERIAQPRPQAADALAWLSCSRMRAAATANDRLPQSHHSWTISELKDAGLSQKDLDLFEGSAVLVRDSWSRSYSLAHERILQWAAAEGSLRALQAEKLHSEELAQLCASILTGETQASWSFGYAPADLLWLLLDPDLPESYRVAAEAILGHLERHHDFLRLEDWLTTLGQRLIPVLFARLRSADPEDAATLYTYRDALKKIPGSEVGQLATKLLAESSLELKEIGVMLLGEREHPPALDALWVLYEEWWIAAHAEKPASLERRKGPWMHHVGIGEKALRRSVRNQPEWLERRLLESESLAGAKSTLLFLLASTPKGEEVWKRHKELLRSRLADDRQRGFVRCIISFRDQEEVPWLESKINEPRLVAPLARRALALLTPERALAQVDPAVLFDLASASWWWLPLTWIQRPKEATDFLNQLIFGSDDPIRTAWVFGGFELWYSREVIQLLLEAVQQELAAIRQGRIEPGKDLPYAPLLRLSGCNTLDQLEVFWEISRSQLEADLADWLNERGPNDEGWAHHGSDEQAGKVLRLIAGPGMARVGRELLERAITWTGGREGLDFAVREPDTEARSMIRRKALDPTLSAPPMATEHPILQCFCLTALAYLRDFEGFAYGVIRWGLQTPLDIAAYLDAHRVAPELLEVAREALARDPIPEGALLLLGFHGGPEALALLHKQSPKVLRSADLKVAWILGLDYSRDCSDETLGVFAEGLLDERTAFFSWNALFHRIGHQRADQLLLSLNPQGSSPGSAGEAVEV